ncbi:MAG: hypothetical protein GXN99_03120 [Candidatus Nanohaloarchaeota archaeon]|nr:hypothetical protein [Candidatus Nanohaloarchaeota archaeon]
MSKSLSLHKRPYPGDDEVIMVYQRAFGYLTPDAKEQYLATFGIGYCVGIYIRSGETQVLAHIDNNYLLTLKGTYLNLTEILLSYLKANELIKEQADVVRIIKSTSFSYETLEGIYNTLMASQITSKIEEWNVHSDIVRILIDKEGNFYELDISTLPKINEGIAKVLGLRIYLQKGLKCENTGKILSEVLYVGNKDKMENEYAMYSQILNNSKKLYDPTQLSFSAKNEVSDDTIKNFSEKSFPVKIEKYEIHLSSNIKDYSVFEIQKYVYSHLDDSLHDLHIKKLIKDLTKQYI